MPNLAFHRLFRPAVSALALIAAALAAVPACAQPAATPAAQPAKREPIRYTLQDGQVTLNVVDLSPQFLAFYEAAKDEPDAGKRYALWKQDYGFAAVPPTPEGEQMARQILDQAWPRYAAALPLFRAGARAFKPDPLETAKKIAAVLRPTEPVVFQYTAFVGGFDFNAFAFSMGGKPVLNVPLELSAEPAFAELIVAHEMTHAFHMAIGHLSGGWERSIAATALQEGLAMQVSREVLPGRPDQDYVARRPGWWEAVGAKRDDILRGMKPFLATSDGQTVFRFTVGQGATGNEREAYYAGWLVVQHLRDKGMSLAEIARVPEAEMPAVVGKAIDEMLAGG